MKQRKGKTVSQSDTTYTETDPWKHTDHKYIGDGVYVSFDGFQIWLRLDAHDAQPLIALEPKVFRKLVRHGLLLLNRGV